MVGIISKNSFFYIFKIVKNYFSVFKGENGYNIFAVYISVGLPLLLAIYTGKYIKLTDKIYENIFLVITILTALFFSALGIILTIKEMIIKKSPNGTGREISASVRKKLSNLTDSIFYADLFEILISIFVLILTFINSCLKNKLVFIDFFIYYLVFVLLINMLLLLKRFYVVINELMKY